MVEADKTNYPPNSPLQKLSAYVLASENLTQALGCMAFYYLII